MAGKSVNKTELSAIVGKSLKTLTVWQEEGMPCILSAQGGNRENEYNTAQVIQWMILRQTKNGFDLEEERAKLAAEQRKTAELKNAKLDGSQIDLEAACAVAQRAAFAIRQRIISAKMAESDRKMLLLELNSLAETDFTNVETEEEEEDDSATEIAASPKAS